MRPVSFLALFTLFLAACAPPRLAPAGAPPLPAPTAPKVGAPPAVMQAVGRLQSGYARADWKGIREQFLKPNVAGSLLALLQRASSRGVQGVRIAAVFSKQLDRHSYVAEVRVADDPRAVPYYFIYRFSVRGGRATIVATDSGLSGKSYTTANWEVTRTAHYTVYHSPYQLVGADRIYLSELEHQRTLFAQRFRVKLPSTAAYYLYPDVNLMKALTRGGCGRRPGEIGCTSPYSHPPTIQAVIQATFHEPIHVYELSLEPHGYEAPLFIGEGTAVALEDPELDVRLSDYCSDLSYAPLDDCARIAVTDVDALKLLSDKGFSAADAGDAYASGGSFVKYLILRYGYYRFGRFYYKLAAQPRDRLRDYNVAAHGVYGQSIQALLSAWKQALCRPGC